MSLNINPERDIINQLYTSAGEAPPDVILYVTSLAEGEFRASLSGPTPGLPRCITADDSDWIQKFAQRQKNNNYEILQPVVHINELFATGIMAAWFMRDCVILLHQNPPTGGLSSPAPVPAGVQGPFL